MAPLEMAAIGFSMAWPEQFYRLSELRAFHFQHPTRRRCFECLHELHEESGYAALTVATVLARLDERGVSEPQAMALLAEARDYCPAFPEGIESIKADLVTRAVRRSMAHAGSEITKLAGSIDYGGDELIDMAGAVLADASRVGRTVVIKTMSEELEAEIRRIESGDKAGTMGYGTGLRVLDDVISGLHDGELIILASRPGMGKSALMNHMAIDLALNQKLPGVIFSFEMPARDYFMRLICNLAMVDIQCARKNAMNEADRCNYIMQAKRMLKEAAKIQVPDEGGLSMPRIASTARQLFHEEGIKWIGIDYFQLIDHHQKSNESTDRAMTRTSNALKSLARNLNIPVVLLSQLNRDCAKRDNKRPQLPDLRSTGSLEQDADVVIFLHREEYYHKDSDDWAENNQEKVGVAELIIAKQRNGPMGIVTCSWLGKSASFRDHYVPNQPRLAGVSGGESESTTYGGRSAYNTQQIGGGQDDDE